MSEHKKQVSLRVVWSGLLLQFVLDELAEGTGAAKDQYKEYLMARAKVIWKEIKVRTES